MYTDSCSRYQTQSTLIESKYYAVDLTINFLHLNDTGTYILYGNESKFRFKCHACVVQARTETLESQCATFIGAFLANRCSSSDVERPVAASVCQYS